MASLRSRFSRAISSGLSHAWNAFTSQNLTSEPPTSMGGGVWYGGRQDRFRSTSSFGGERSIIASIYNRLSIDAASLAILHVRLNDDGQFVDIIDSGLNQCLTIEANLDQAARHFRQDIISTMFRKGTVAIVPVDTTVNPSTASFDIKTMRVGEVLEWRSQHVRVRVYNERTGLQEDIWLEKKFVAIAENPFYEVMNEPNSTLRRLIEKLCLLDAIDKQSGSGKLDLIIQLPYVVKGEAMRTRAEQRKADVEYQLQNSQYGIAYIDGTEKITQLNRPAENNLLKQVEYLTNMLYSQLGLTPEVMNGTADEAAMLNYYARTIDPIVSAPVEAMLRTFLTKTARSQKQSIMAFHDPFKFVPLGQIAEIADKFTRSNVATPNDIRPKIGLRPSKDPVANTLGNPNMPNDKQLTSGPQPAIGAPPKQLQLTGSGGSNQNGA
jgi:hypothetical protein